MRLADRLDLLGIATLEPLAPRVSKTKLPAPPKAITGHESAVADCIVAMRDKAVPIAGKRGLAEALCGYAQATIPATQADALVWVAAWSLREAARLREMQ